MNLKKSLFLVFLIIIDNTIYSQTDENRQKSVEKINLVGVTVTEVVAIPSGSYTAPSGKTFDNLPEFVRVAIVSKPSPESKIRVEVWLPKTGWNGRLLGTGTGGGAGSINYNALAAGIKRGFATVNTDMGTSPGVYEIIDYSEKWKDFGYRATHEMTVIAKAIVKTYYQKEEEYSYFAGCSTGGQQALMEAQRFPDDYDGIIVGAPANNRTHLHASFIWNLQANNRNGEEVLSNQKMKLLLKILLQQYNGKDGGAPDDSFLSDTRVCSFDPEVLPRCSAIIESDSCFTSAELDALGKIYGGPVNPRTGERIYSPLPMGASYVENAEKHLYPFFWVFGKDFNYRDFNFDGDMAKVDSVLAPILNANNPDLSAIKKNGGKIIMYAGTNDQLVLPQDAINYYDRVVEEQDGLKETQDFFRLFLIPGMGHCGGGPGLNDFGQSLSLKVCQDADHDILTALINWVEKGDAPQKIIASSFFCCENSDSIRLQRPLYPYPLFPVYKNGDPALPSSFRPEKRMGNVLKPAEVYLK